MHLLDGSSALYDAVFNDCIISDINIVHDNRIFDNTIVSNICLLEYNRVFNCTVYNTSTCDQAV